MPRDVPSTMTSPQGRTLTLTVTGDFGTEAGAAAVRVAKVVGMEAAGVAEVVVTEAAGVAEVAGADDADVGTCGGRGGGCGRRTVGGPGGGRW